MKRMMKTAVAIGLTLAFCAALTGCEAIGVAVYGLLGGSLDDSSSSESSSQSAPPPAASSSQSEAGEPPASSSQPAPESEPAPAPALALNPGAIAFLGQTNGQLKQANGTACAAYIMYGGSPVADYTGAAAAWPLAFWLGADQADLMAVWGQVSDGAGHAPQENFWPDHYSIDMLEAWGDGIGLLFSTGGPVTYAMLAEVYGEEPALAFTAANEGVDYSYAVDTWEGEYQNIGGYQMQAVFTKNGGDYELYLLRLW